MAIIYFTSNADSGDGTLRAAIADANDGDVITYDPAVFTSGPIVIYPATALITANKNLTYDGGELGIVLDGQGANLSAVSLANVTVNIINFTIKCLHRNQAAPVYLNDADGVLNLHRCRIVDNENRYFTAVYANAGICNIYDSLLAGNNVTTSGNFGGGCGAGANGAVNLYRSTVIYNTQNNLYGAARINRTDSFVGLSPPTISGETPEEIGFINPPAADVISLGSWTEGAWENYDFRLAPGSAYLTGAAYNPGDLDLLGHARAGSWGAFDGSWIVATGSATVSANQTVDWLDLAASAVLTLDGQDRILTVARGVYSVATGAAVVSATNGFVVAPAATDLANATLTNVVCAVSGAGASNLAATTTGISWSATDSTVSVVLQLQSGSTWTTIAQTAGTSYSTTLAAGSVVRLFDGVNFLTATVPVPPGPTPTDFDFHAWGVYDATITVDVGVPFLTTTQTAAVYKVATDFILMSQYFNRGETPVLFARIQNSETGQIISPSAVSSISYTAYSKTVGWGSETRTPVDGHENETVPNSAVLSALVPPSTDPRWTVDSTGYNFIFEPDSTVNPIFPNAGDYVVVVTINFTAANPLPISFDVSVN